MSSYQLKARKDSMSFGDHKLDTTASSSLSSTDLPAALLKATRSGDIDAVKRLLDIPVDVNSSINGLTSLHLASKEGHMAILLELLCRGANVDATTKKLNTALHIASLAGHAEIVNVLVDHGCYINCRSASGFTPLYMAAQENHLEVVEILLNKGADQNLATDDGFTPLAVALQQGHRRIVSLLLENESKYHIKLPALHVAARKNDTCSANLLLKADSQLETEMQDQLVNCVAKNGFTPLHIAAHYGNVEVAELLIMRGADVNFAAQQKISPLHVASKCGKDNMVRLLLNNNAQIDARTQGGLTPLHCAARSGRDQVIDTLLERGAPITAKTINGLTALHMTAQYDFEMAAKVLLSYKPSVIEDVTCDYLSALHVAAHCGSFAVAKLLLERRAKINAKALNGFTPLHIASKKGHFNIAQILLKHGANVDSVTESDLTPLHVASFIGGLNVMSLLIENGAKMNAVTVRGETPLHIATRANRIESLQCLLQNHADINAIAATKQTCLHIAAHLGLTDTVNFLLEKGAAVDLVTKSGCTALHLAAVSGRAPTVTALLDHGASLTMCTKKGFTPLHIACKYGNIKIVSLLLQRHAMVDYAGRNGLRPLQVAVHYDHPNIVLVLLRSGASPDDAAMNGYTALHIAAKKNHIEIVRVLLEYNVKVNVYSNAGFAPLHMACQEGHLDMVDLLIFHGADVNAMAENNLTPLHLCSQENRVPCAQKLIKSGATIDPSTKAGFTPLHVACHFGNVEVVQFLIQVGANIEAVTKLGYTPLHCATQQGHLKVLTLLLEHGASAGSLTKHGQSAIAIAENLGFIKLCEELTLNVDESSMLAGQPFESAYPHEAFAANGSFKIQIPESLLEESPLRDSDDELAAEEIPVEEKVHALSMQYSHYDLSQNRPEDDFTDGFAVSHIPMIGHPTSAQQQQQQQQQHHQQHYQQQRLHSSPELAPHKIVRRSSMKSSATDVAVVSPQTSFTTDDICHVDTFDDGARRMLVIEEAENERPLINTHLFPMGKIVSNQHMFLVSFVASAKGALLQGQRKSGIRFVMPPKSAGSPTRINCRFLTGNGVAVGANQTQPSLNDGEALVCRVLELRPVGYKFLSPILLQIPHFAALHNGEREVIVYRSNNGEKWTEHGMKADPDTIKKIIVESESNASEEERKSLEVHYHDRIANILTNDIPRYFALCSRITQDVILVDQHGTTINSTFMPRAIVYIPERALQKPVKVALQVCVVSPELVRRIMLTSTMLRSSDGSIPSFSPIISIEPRRRKFHKPITLTVPLPPTTSVRHSGQIVIDNASQHHEEAVYLDTSGVERKTGLLGVSDGGSVQNKIVMNGKDQVSSKDNDQSRELLIGKSSGQSKEFMHSRSPTDHNYNGNNPHSKLDGNIKERKASRDVSIIPDADNVVDGKDSGNHKESNRNRDKDHQRRNEKGVYTSDSQSLRLLCSITGGAQPAHWEDITGHTPLTFQKDTVTFTSTVSARFWLIDTNNATAATKIAQAVYGEIMAVPFMATFLVYAKRIDFKQTVLRVICATDVKDSLLESKEKFTKVAHSKEVEIFDKRNILIEQDKEYQPEHQYNRTQWKLPFNAFQDNRVDMIIHNDNNGEESAWKICLSFYQDRFMSSSTIDALSDDIVSKQLPLCSLLFDAPSISETCSDMLTRTDRNDIFKKYLEPHMSLHGVSIDSQNIFTRVHVRLVDVANALGDDWPTLGYSIGLTADQMDKVKEENPSSPCLAMLRDWIKKHQNNGNILERALRAIGKEKVIHSCMFDMQPVKSDQERSVAATRVSPMNDVWTRATKVDSDDEDEDDTTNTMKRLSTATDRKPSSATNAGCDGTDADLEDGRSAGIEVLAERLARSIIPARFAVPSVVDPDGHDFPNNNNENNENNEPPVFNAVDHGDHSSDNADGAPHIRRGQ